MEASIIQFKRTVISPLSGERTIYRSEFKERCFIYQSFGYQESMHGDMEVRPHVSFLADSGNGTAAEWEPQYGPIQIWTQCDEDFGDDGMKARKHWHFPFVQDKPLDWSQLAVDNEGLKSKLIAGNLDGVFDVLLKWADR